MKRHCLASVRLLPTLLLGACGGGLAYAIHMPLPWLLGALIVTTVLSLGGARLQAPTTSRKAVLVIIGVMLGTAFTADMGGDIALWATSLTIMLVSTAVMMMVSVWMSRRIAGNSIDTAAYAGMPGGVSTVILMASETDADLRVVGLTHAVRILVVLLAIPVILHVIGHVSLQAPAITLAQWFSFPDFADALLLIGAGVIGYWLGRLLRLPNPLLFGPVLASAMLHITGTSDASVPPFIVAFAQVLIGVSVGVRFAGTSLAAVGFNLLIAFAQALVLLLTAFVAAWTAHLITGYSAAAALLAYMPGGAPELSLVALSLGIEPAFVTSHHLLRITVLILLTPMLVAWMKRLHRA
ncbi:MAG TPA: AbrB family transcriptional regulator [Marinobacter antarcticus]|uniref:AbrB family transcriptional regulator n=3 Tax=root TaxID=1 RepID=A0A831R7Y7_9GAMM|nr:AbrB family transcriptional regulator [Marinobacter antarcticus]